MPEFSKEEIESYLHYHAKKAAKKVVTAAVPVVEKIVPPVIAETIKEKTMSNGNDNGGEGLLLIGCITILILLCVGVFGWIIWQWACCGVTF
jgi:hypothetical protein